MARTRSPKTGHLYQVVVETVPGVPLDFGSIASELSTHLHGSRVEVRAHRGGDEDPGLYRGVGTCRELLVVDFAALGIGATAAFIPPSLDENELAAIFAEVQPKVVFTSGQHVD